MSILASAVGAIIAAIIESSALTHLRVDGFAPDLLFAVAVGLAMTLGFESAMAWAFVGGIVSDLLMPERALGSTSLALLLVTALALVVARATWPPRLAVVAATGLVLTPLYQMLLLALLAVTAGVAWVGLSLPDLLAVAITNAVIAVVAAVLLRALDLRFGEPERTAW
jgi:cell shape-determining protein MreD